LRENIEDVADENGVQEKKNVCLLKREKFLQGKFNVAQGWGMVKRNRMRVCWEYDAWGMRKMRYSVISDQFSVRKEEE
jgi:hypothetical protein